MKRPTVMVISIVMGKPGAKADQKDSGAAAEKPAEKKGPMHISKGAKKAKNSKANHGGKTDRKPL